MQQKIDFDQVSQKLGKFIQKHKTAFMELPGRHTAILELAALAMSAEHYKIKGYNVAPQNLINAKFRVKTSASGIPKNFSWFNCIKQECQIEIHANLPIYGAHKDRGIYVVDVAVALLGKAATINASNNKRIVGKDGKKKKRIYAIKNKDLVTFMEVKKLVIYPMLLAQFVGIVHEIKPKFLKGKLPVNFDFEGHFYPCLATTGYLTENAKRIIEGFNRRSMKLLIAPDFENRFLYLKDNASESPLLPPKKPNSENPPF